MVMFAAAVPPKMISLDAKIMRCGCTESEKLLDHWHGRRNQPCPKPRSIEDCGTVAYWHRNPLKRLYWRFREFLRGRHPGRIHIES